MDCNRVGKEGGSARNQASTAQPDSPTRGRSSSRFSSVSSVSSTFSFRLIGLRNSRAEGQVRVRGCQREVRSARRLTGQAQTHLARLIALIAFRLLSAIFLMVGTSLKRCSGVRVAMRAQSLRVLSPFPDMSSLRISPRSATVECSRPEPLI